MLLVFVGFARSPLCLLSKENNAVDNNDRYYIEDSRKRDAVQRLTIQDSICNEHLRHGRSQHVGVETDCWDHRGQPTGCQAECARFHNRCACEGVNQAFRHVPRSIVSLAHSQRV